jgi:DNA-binding NarL/FixJ family response regulator
MMRILIADDSKIYRTYMIDLLSKIEGIEIAGQAEDSPSAVEAIERLNPDVAILDIRMPGGDGILALETIKRNKVNPKTIMFTNYPYPQYRKKCMDAGADYFFDKSTEFEKLVEVLKELVQEGSYTKTVEGGLKIAGQKFLPDKQNERTKHLKQTKQH